MFLGLVAEVGKVKTTDQKLLMLLLLLTVTLFVSVLLSLLILGFLLLVEPLCIENCDSFSQHSQEFISFILQGAKLFCFLVLVLWTDSHQILVGKRELLPGRLTPLSKVHEPVQANRPILGHLRD